MAKVDKVTIEVPVATIAAAIVEKLTEDGSIVEVVRCKDCKCQEDAGPGMVYCPYIVGGWVSEDFFCADGERRDDAEVH